jgi:hypothetical protein
MQAIESLRGMSSSNTATHVPIGMIRFWLADIFREGENFIYANNDSADNDSTNNDSTNNDLTHSAVAQILRGDGFVRLRRCAEYEAVLDHFESASARGACVQAASLRFSPANNQPLWLGLMGSYRFQATAAGGWLLLPAETGADAYWLPQAPMLRRLDKDGHILTQHKAEMSGFEVSAFNLGFTLAIPAEHVVDLVAWRISAIDVDLILSLQQLNTLELQSYFLWSSHTVYAKPADVYLHLVHGHVYENHSVWPRYWRICSELDAYALYVVLTGLFRATGKRLYDLLRIQVVFSVIARQAEDGGWYHGEWSNDMESHYRLHAGGMQMLAACFEETHDSAVGAALKKAAAFAASRTDRLRCGMWYLHDSLEQNTQTLKKYPFRYVVSRALGKLPSNLLVLNTHLDTNIAMQRYRQITGDAHYDELIASANATTRSILKMQPAEWLYRTVFRAIRLTFLPVAQAKALSLPLRVIKRIAWKHLVPNLPRIKQWFPRLVMPGGYIERDLVQRSFSVRYQSINLMDLIRTRHLFSGIVDDAWLESCFDFTQTSGIKARWKECQGKEDDALGFWAEALYHLCLDKPDARYRNWLAEAIIDLEDNGLGLSPSLLGTNAEAIALDQQRACPSPAHFRLRLANLSRGDRVEWLVVNSSTKAIPLEWDAAPMFELAWQGHSTQGLQQSELQQSGLPNLTAPPVIPSRSWVIGTALQPGNSELDFNIRRQAACLNA